MTTRWMSTLSLLTLATLAGCASDGSAGLSSLGREVDVQPLRGQSADLLKQDDTACESWTRITKGPSEPLPSAELRYSACAMSRGYSVKPWDHRISPPATPLRTSRAWWRTCRPAGSSGGCTTRRG